jgi:precorrin-6A/cobalt-precorrin-6A reductase
MLLVFAGTSDARELALRIQRAGHPLIASVVSESASKSLQEAGLRTRTGRLTAEATLDYIREHGITGIVDASHPFAEDASKNAMAAAKQAGIPYIRFERRESELPEHPLLFTVSSYEEAADLAAQWKGVIMLTTGSKTLQVFTKRLLGDPEVTLVARMLPRTDNMVKCEELGIEQRNIVAMQGPFSKALNIALYRHFGVTTMITKESGKAGAVDEKITAALELGIRTIVIARPEIPYGTVYSTFEEVLEELRRRKETTDGIPY